MVSVRFLPSDHYEGTPFTPVAGSFRARVSRDLSGVAVAGALVLAVALLGAGVFLAVQRARRAQEERGGKPARYGPWKRNNA